MSSGAAGTAPRGVRGEGEVSRWVRAMFGRVAARYDLLNHLLSLNLDRWWRRRTVSRLQHVLARPGVRVLDLCCGTGDLLAAMHGRCSGVVFGSDFCRPMLVRARRKTARLRPSPALFEADALRLPVADRSLDVVTVAFGFRNLANYGAGLQELRRVLRPSGVAAILEFSTPPGRCFAAAYHFYVRRILPVVGGVISGDREAYRYLPESVRNFPGAEELAVEMRRAGFRQAEFERLSGGIVCLHLGSV